jgi:hypothetical protein
MAKPLPTRPLQPAGVHRRPRRPVSWAIRDPELDIVDAAGEKKQRKGFMAGSSSGN